MNPYQKNIRPNHDIDKKKIKKKKEDSNKEVKKFIEADISLPKFKIKSMSSSFDSLNDGMREIINTVLAHPPSPKGRDRYLHHPLNILQSKFGKYSNVSRILGEFQRSKNLKY